MKTVFIHLTKNQIEAYISELAAKYDTVGTERTFNTYDGREITVSGGNYGWQIDQKAELKELTELIKNRRNPGQRTCLFP